MSSIYKFFFNKKSYKLEFLIMINETFVNKQNIYKKVAVSVWAKKN